LGLALQKSQAEIRALPNPEFIKWKLLYLLEPFGWGAHHALLYNINRASGNAKTEDDLMNERAQAILEELQELPDLAEMPKDELIKMAKQAFGVK
jgi:hypothetical protein